MCYSQTSTSSNYLITVISCKMSSGNRRPDLFSPGPSVSLISPMFRDIGDLGLGILPGEGFKKIWASCLLLYIVLFVHIA